jgi:methylenetetrahydrofolate dehydrogenase (NADP+) / methenyltetrahydrofolate cyclohydrolase
LEEAGRREEIEANPGAYAELVRAADPLEREPRILRHGARRCQAGAVTATILDGKRIGAEMRAEAGVAAARLAAEGRAPGLAVVLVGDDPASRVYVGSKSAAAREAGIAERTLRFDAGLAEADLLRTVDALNRDDSVDAILVQLPLPPQISSRRVLEAIDPAKDVDGFHPLNAGRLVQGTPAPAPCTPAGILDMLKRERIALAGLRALVLGRSDIVGKPMATLLLRESCTVTIAHSKTRDLPAVCR